MDRDRILIDVFADMFCQHRCSADNILCVPPLREEFVSRSRQRAGADWDEAVILGRLINLRKQSRLRRRDDGEAA